MMSLPDCSSRRRAFLVRSTLCFLASHGLAPRLLVSRFNKLFPIFPFKSTLNFAPARQREICSIFRVFWACIRAGKSAAKPAGEAKMNASPRKFFAGLFTPFS
jgi:hypothetical protein